MCKTININPIKGRRPEHFDGSRSYELDFSEVKGRREAKRAVEISVGGFHHLLMSGPPGCGKSMVAKRIASVLPIMDYEEMLESAAIYSIYGRDACKEIYKYIRPFRAPAIFQLPQ